MWVVKIAVKHVARTATLSLSSFIIPWHGSDPCQAFPFSQNRKWKRPREAWVLFWNDAADDDNVHVAVADCLNGSGFSRTETELNAPSDF